MVRVPQRRAVLFLLCGPWLIAACGKVESQERERVSSEKAAVTDETVTKRESSSSVPARKTESGDKSGAKASRSSQESSLVPIVRGTMSRSTEERRTYVLEGDDLPKGFESDGTAFYLYPKARVDSVPVYLCAKDGLSLPSLDVGCEGGTRGRLVGHAARNGSSDTEPVHLSSKDETPSFHAPIGDGGDA